MVTENKCIVASLEMLADLFCSEGKCAVIYGTDFAGRMKLVNEYVSKYENVHGRIVRISPSVGEFEFNGRIYRENTDNNIRNCFIKPYVSDISSGRSPEELFESSLKVKTLAVIESYDMQGLSPYLRHILSLGINLIVLCDKPFKTSEYLHINSDELLCETYVEEVVTDAGLDAEEYELLVSLSLMMFALCDGYTVDCTFAKECLGQLYRKTEILVEKKLVHVLNNEYISVDFAVAEYVIKQNTAFLKICSHLRDYFDRILDFEIYQPAKDILSEIRTVGGNAVVGGFDKRILDLYCVFAPTDEKRNIRVYNLVFGFLMNNLSKGGSCGFTEHLKWNTRNKYLFMLYQVLMNFSDEIYADCCFSAEETESHYTPEVRAKFDVIRVCVLLLRNLPACMYNSYGIVFGMLKDAMCWVSDRAENIEVNRGMELLDDVIRMCSEVFSGFSAVCEDGYYRSLADDVERGRICWCGDRMTDAENSYGLSLGYSSYTAELYGVYMTVLKKWLAFEKKTFLHDNSEETRCAHDIKKEERQKLCKEMSRHFTRCAKGYGVFFDFFDKRYENINISDELDKVSFDKKANENKHLAMRGFDNGMKTVGDMYALQIMAAVKTSKKPLVLLRLVLDCSFRLSDYTYSKLYDLKLQKYFAVTKKISDHDKVLFAQHILAEMYCAVEKPHLVLLYCELIRVFLKASHSKEKLCSKLLPYISLSYLMMACNQSHPALAEDLFSEIYGMADNTSGPEIRLAYFVYNGMKKIKSSVSLKDISVFIREYLFNEHENVAVGFLKVIKECNDKKVLAHTLSEIERYILPDSNIVKTEDIPIC